MDQQQINDLMDNFNELKNSINAEQDEKRRLELYEEMQQLKDSILIECSKNKFISIMIKLIQFGMI